MSLLKASCYEINIARDGSWKQDYTGSLSKVQHYDGVTSSIPYENINNVVDLRMHGAPSTVACATINLALFDLNSSGSTSRTIFVEGEDPTSLGHLDQLTQWSECTRPYMSGPNNNRVLSQRDARPPHLRLIILTWTVTLISGMNSKDLLSLHRYIVIERDPTYSEVHCVSRKIRQLCDRLDHSFSCGILLMMRDRGTGFLNRIGTILEQFADEVGAEQASSLYLRMKSLIASINGIHQ